MLAFILPWAVMPFSSSLILADLNIGILYMTAVTALTVVGVLMAGWASNNKWSLIGGIRSAAQIISYEIPAGLSIFPIVLMTGTLSMQGIIRAQGWAPDRWFMFANPFCFVAAIILFISGLAENNRTPFDLPEAESELVAGFATEYSSMRYLFFFMAEWGNMFIAAAIVTDAVSRRMAVSARQRQSGRDERAAVRDLQSSKCCSGVRFDVDKGDAAARANRPDDVALLEVLGADLVHGPDWHGGVGGDLARRQSDRAVDHAGGRSWRSLALFIWRVCLLRETLPDGTLLPSDDLTSAGEYVMGTAASYFRHIKDAVVSIFDGMAVTASHFVRKPYTIQYPDRIPVRVQDTLPFRYRGILEVDMEICTGCLACDRACPIDCIAIAIEKNAQTREIADLAVRYRYRQVHVLRVVQRAVSDRRDSSHDGVRGRGLFAREPDPAVHRRAGRGVQGQKGPEPDPEVAKLFERGMKYVDEWAQPGSDKPATGSAPKPAPVAASPRPAPVRRRRQQRRQACHAGTDASGPTGPVMTAAARAMAPRTA